VNAYKDFAGAVRPLMENIGVIGKSEAYEVGYEHGQLKIDGQQVAIEQRVTNIYRREAGVWKIVHHHTDVSPAMLGVINPLKAET
jgi:ketosteroid isomerase-like protein